ncbi:interferon-induced very large GTPase 1-like [Aplochiton taeniatus]
MLDYRARYIPVSKEDSDGHHTKNKSKDVNLRTEDDDDDDAYDVLFNSGETDPKMNQAHIHPMDVQMAIFHCSDNFLRQYMVTKLSLCQYALPLLVPDPFNQDIECPLWTFRQITKNWKFTDSLKGITSKSVPVSNAQTPMVSFFRLGSVSSSKSQLMNNLINERHSTFFHRDRPGSTKTRVLMDGVAEIAWYCPAGKANDAFTDCIAFCNLHGDALSNERQRQILIDKASVNVVLLPTLEKGDISMTIVSELLKIPKPLICLLSEDNSGAIELREGKYKIGLKDRSQSDVSEELKRILCKTLSAPVSWFCIEDMTKVSGIRVDEEDEDCQTGRNAALQVLEPLKGVALSNIKATYLPCQGKLWHDWCQKNKELYRLKENLEMEKSKIHQELKVIRLKQRGSEFSDLMQYFFTFLRSMPSNEKTYFLKWIGILLDELCTEELSEIHREYNKVWSEVLTLKKTRTEPDLLKIRQAALEAVSENLQSATIGFEHILREMGQIYEAHASLSKEKTLTNKMNISYLPELAADLMISGHPMELMDGDAAHVPLTWINSVLDEVTRKLNDPRIFVLSVLGIQSTGKSTMLNAMFGLQFAVSAGRCTRGAFMQLVRVSDEIKKENKFDYVLVVDTEGLRALELAGKTTVHHDNELATFVIGLGNMTLVNIFGENPAEMQDVLQIAVQAFMRMKKVKLHPSCVFVHQNVGDITAGEKNMEGKRRLQEKLDEMTLLAAKEEGESDECFSDVIAFDVQKDVKYFAQLWEGSPPMAPPNPGYSESVQELKNMILSKTKESAGMPLSTFKRSIHDLWNALLNENFVFSFKNTLEIAVYRKLEVQYGKWTWSLRSAMLTIENQFHNRIENEKLHKVDQKDLVAEMRTAREDVDAALKTYFDEDGDKDILVQWRGRFESRIVELHDELVKGVKRKLEDLIQQRLARKKLDDKTVVYEKTLFQMSKELALKLKDTKMNENELNEKFNTVWEGWVQDVTMDTPSIGDINIAEDLDSVLEESGYELSFVYSRQSCKTYLDITKGNYSEYVTLKKQHDLRTASQETQQHTQIQENNEETPPKRIDYGVLQGI